MNFANQTRIKCSSLLIVTINITIFEFFKHRKLIILQEHVLIILQEHHETRFPFSCCIFAFILESLRRRKIITLYIIQIRNFTIKSRILHTDESNGR